MSVSSGPTSPRPALCLGYTNQCLFLENSFGLLLLKQWPHFELFSSSTVRPASYAGALREQSLAQVRQGLCFPQGSPCLAGCSASSLPSSLISPAGFSSVASLILLETRQLPLLRKVVSTLPFTWGLGQPTCEFFFGLRIPFREF